MKTKLRKLGIDIIKEAPWGTHICQFYQTKEDLIDILVPYFKIGLENNELCMWITSEPLTAEEAKISLEREVKNLDEYRKKGQIEILDYSQWYTKSGKFNADKVLESWVEKEKHALQKGFDGLRLTGNTFWLEPKDWEVFAEYEAVIDNVIGKYHMIAICSYSVKRCKASEILDVVSNHQYCLIRQNGKWRLSQSFGRKRSEIDLKKKTLKLNERIKELNCLYGISHLVEKSDSLEKILQGTVDLIPPAGQYPEITCVKLICEDQEFITENFTETKWKITSTIMVNDKHIGSLQVYYLEEKPESDEGPFLKEERTLINSIAEELGRIIERKRAEEALKKYRFHLEELVKERTDKLTVANEHLRQSERKYSTLVEQANDGVCVLQDEVFIYVNKVTAEILGYKVEELIGKPLKDILIPEYREQNIQRLRARLAGEKLPTTYENKCVCKDGKIKDVELSLSVIEYKEKPALMVIVHDVTERKKMTDDLRRSEERWRKYFEFGYIGTAVTSLRKEWIEVNDRMCEILGYSRQELMKMTWTELTYPEDLAKDVKQFNRVLAGEIDGYSMEKRFIHKDRKIINTILSVKCLHRSDGSVDYFLGSVQDITERKKMQEELQKIDKLEAVGVLAGGIAHDFNNLLTAILGNLSLAELHVKHGDNAYETLMRAKKASRQAGKLTQQLLTFSKGGVPIKETSSISELIKETATFALRGSRLKCEYSIADNLWLAEIDKGQISQVIHNLIINADHAMPNAGIIRIDVKNVTIWQHDLLPLQEGKYIKISVKDEGSGIPKEHLPKVFDPYFSTKENGSGLGLASCFSIIKNHKGHITVKSEQGVGTTFHIYLPASEKELFEVKEIKEERSYLGHGKILFMDDEQEVIDTAQQMLLELGYEVETAKTGAEAVKLYKKAKEIGQSFDAVILDLTIPGYMGGRETIKKLLEIDPEVKAIVSSGYSNNPIMAEYTQYGFRDVVAKPYEIQMLSKTLYEVINGFSFQSK